MRQPRRAPLWRLALLASVLCGNVASAQRDLSGVWMAIRVENMSPGSAFSPAGFERLWAFRKQFSAVPEPGAACVGNGMPGMMMELGSYPIEIVQTGSRLLMVGELHTQVRRVFIDGRTRPDTAFPTTVGYSIGAWEGDTLVIRTDLLDPWPLSAWPRSAAMQIVERLALTTSDKAGIARTGFFNELEAPQNDDVLVVDITVTDLEYYDGPQRRVVYYERMGDDATSEYACSQALWREALDEFRIANQAAR